MKGKKLLLISLIIAAFIGGTMIWNFGAGRASAQVKADSDAENLGIIVASEYNARSEFSLTQGGTSGVWRYGYSASPTDNAFTEFTVSDTIALCGGNFERWYVPNADVIPQIARHNLTTTCSNVSGCPKTISSKSAIVSSTNDAKSRLPATRRTASRTNGSVVQARACGHPT